MSTNASTWFYNEPEHSAYLIEERVNHTFWNNRMGAIYFDCTHAEPPFRMVGEWNGNTILLEWVPNEHLTLSTPPGDDADLLIIGMKEILGFVPAISYVDPDGMMHAEWHVNNANERIQAVQSNSNYRNIKRYKR
jgi:hypothetical protein